MSDDTVEFGKKIGGSIAVVRSVIWGVIAMCIAYPARPVEMLADWFSVPKKPQQLNTFALYIDLVFILLLQKPAKALVMLLKCPFSKGGTEQNELCRFRM